MKKNRCTTILSILTKNKNNKKGFHEEAFFIYKPKILYNIFLNIQYKLFKGPSFYNRYLKIFYFTFFLSKKHMKKILH